MLKKLARSAACLPHVWLGALVLVFATGVQAQSEQEPRVYRDRVAPHWFGDNERFWYRNHLPKDASEFVLVNAKEGTRQPAFDHARLAEALGKALGKSIEAGRLPVESLEFSPNGNSLELQGGEGRWNLTLGDYSLAKLEAEQGTEGSLPLEREPRPSRQGGKDSGIILINKLAEDLEVFWLDPDRARVPYGILKAGEEKRQHTFAGHVWLLIKATGEVAAVFEATDKPAKGIIDSREPERRTPPRNRRRRDRPPETSEVSLSPDKKWEAFVREHNLWLREVATGERKPLSFDGSPGHSFRKDVSRERLIGMNYELEDPPATMPEVLWSPDSRRLVALRTRTVPERRVHLVESSPRDGGQPKLQSYPYLKPGDEIPIQQPRLFEAASRREIALANDLFPNPWDIGNWHWSPDGARVFFVYNQRGHQLLRVLELDAATGGVRTIVEEASPTFVDYSGKFFLEHLDDKDELIWMSERDGWNHLWLYDRAAGRVKNQITKGEWVAQGVERVDGEKRQIWFRAGGVRSGQDPYHTHHCRVNFDGSGLVILTEGDGTHEIEWSPDRRYFLDTWSRVDLPPVTELRHADGRLLCRLEEADVSELWAAGRRFPQRFAAKGRDGQTDIFGIIHRPKDFDPAKKYPVIENIYAGPHGFHVPKAFRPGTRTAKLIDQGFILVQIDGMGTSGRSKKFHDVCWKNLADAGFPDRIAWMKAAAAAHPEMDLTRVGVFGGSAGGQNALGALLTHGDFYKVAVADCGCHDNRMDKIWWNEQWMGWPVGPHYHEQSNVTMAHRLRGKLMLIVGELDKNVDPASTMQVADALVRADKDFDLVIIPGVGHGAASGGYGFRRLMSFFREHL